MSKCIDSCRVYTPEPLAKAMTHALGQKDGLRWLEPGVGQGVFLRSIADLGVKTSDIVGVDIDRRKSEFDEVGTIYRGRDFLRWAEKQGRSFDRIVGNPPFVAIEKLDDPIRSRAAEVRSGSIGPLGQNGNLWASFLIASLNLLRPEGNLSFVLPAAWAYADYAADLRKKLPTYFTEFVCHRSNEVLFPDVQDGCYVLQCFGYGRPNRISSAHIYKHGTDLTKGLRPPVRPTAPHVHRHLGKPPMSSEEAGALFKVRLGAVTGDASYFLLSEERKDELGLPMDSLKPVVTRARHLSTAIIDGDHWKRIRKSGDRAYLFRPVGDACTDDAVQKYLRLHENNGGCDRRAGWVSKRQPWYEVALPSKAHGFMSGVSSSGPWISLNAMEDLTATNTLYVIQFAEWLTSRNARASCALSLLTSTAQDQIRRKTRTYAGGMLKLEPSDITSLIVPVRAEVGGAGSTYRMAVDSLLLGNKEGALQIADEWFASV